VLGDDHHTIDGEFAGAEGEGVFDGGAELHLGVAVGALLKEVALAVLIDVERDDVHRWMVIDAVPSIAVEKAVDNVLRVKISSIRRNYASKPRALS